MQSLIRRGLTFYARYYVPRERWADVGKAMGAPGGLKREVVRTLRTTNRRAAGAALRPALAAIHEDIEAALRAAGLRPLTDWTADWAQRAVAWRATLAEARESPAYGEQEVEVLADVLKEDAQRVEEEQGWAEAEAFYRAATTTKLTIEEAAQRWLTEVKRGGIRDKTIAGHRAVLELLARFLRENYGKPALSTVPLDDVSRRVAGEFIEWRARQVSGTAVKREASTVMGLWRWAERRGHIEGNPWRDQTAGLTAWRGGRDEDRAKRPFTAPELVTLLSADAATWAPNEGGYAVTLWDATRLALLTGLRAAELADLRLGDLVEQGTALRIRAGKTRNARRLVPLPAAAQVIIAARLADIGVVPSDAPLWPEIPVLRLTGSRGNKLSDRFRMARTRILPDATGVDFHSLRRSYATALEAAMHRGGRINPTVVASLMGHQRGTLALDLYSGGAEFIALRNAVDDMATLGLAAPVQEALALTMDQRPRMVRRAPVKRT